MPRILITGAAGFLGSHLCDRFIKEGYQVVGMDNLLTGNKDNIAHLFPLPEFEYYHHDVSKFVHVAGPLGLHPALRLAGQPHRLPKDADPDPEGWCTGHA